jgi:Ca-activated chloride channel family protein
MRPLRLLPLLLIVPLWGFPQQTTFRTDVRLVNVAFSVRDTSGKLIDDLSQGEVEVLEDGVPQKVAFFGRSAETTLNLGLIVDASGSQASFVKAHQKDLKAFLDSVMDPRDRSFLLCFGNHPRLVTEFTASSAAIVRALEGFMATGRKSDYPELGPAEIRTAGTAFYDAVYHSSEVMFRQVERGRKALIVFSDGEDNASAHHEMEAIEAAQANDVLLFSVRYTEVRGGVWNARNKYGRSIMARMARETGGADFDAAEKTLREHFREIGDQLRSSYQLAYHSTNSLDDRTFRKLAIRVARPGLTVRAKTGYYAR